MHTKKIDLKLVGTAILPALGVSVAVILLGEALGLPEGGIERASQILFFSVFLAVCYAKQGRIGRTS